MNWQEVIERVVDGDTVVVNNEKIRLLNVTNEESVHPNEEEYLVWSNDEQICEKGNQHKETILQCSGQTNI